MTENDLQRAVAKVLDYSGLTWFHPPMEGFRTPRSGGHMKAKGSKAGVPDCMIFQPFRTYGPVDGFPGETWQTVHGLALELKVGKNKPTPAQLEWADKLRACGWRVEVCRSMDEVLAVLRECYPAKFTM
jgi:hypothetical protein